MLMDAIRTADWVLLMAQDPGLPIRPAGILLLDPLADKLHIALDDFVSTDEDIREVWESLKEELADKASEMGGARLLDWLAGLARRGFIAVSATSPASVHCHGESRTGA
jgi:hypothetical protein